MVLAKKLADDEAPKTRLDPVKRDEMEHNVTLANSSTHPVDQSVKVRTCSKSRPTTPAARP
jgi:hypothetical protein